MNFNYKPVFAFILALVSHLALAAEKAASAGCAAPAWAEVVSDIDEIRQRAKVAGMALLVVDRDRIVCAVYRGLADRQSGRPVDQQTWFRVGSVSKSFTALGALRLAESGQLELAAPLPSMLAELAQNKWAGSHPLNLGQLLQHSAGLPDMSGSEFNFANDGSLTLKQALAISPQSRRLRWPPGLHPSYSNSGAGLVGLAMEQASGESFQSIMQAQVLDPLGMTDASFERTEVVAEHLATGYNTDGVSVIPYWHIIYRPAGGLNLRPLAMRPFLQMLLRGGETERGAFLNRQSIHLLEDPSETLAARSGLQFGRGMGNYHTQFRGRSLHGHGGDADGYLAHYGYSKDSGLGYFLVINAFQPPTLRRMRERVQQQLIADLPKPTYPEEFEIAAELMTQMAGDYSEVTRRFAPRPGQAALRVEIEEGRLHTIDADGDKNPMIAVNATHFRRPWQSVATMALLPDGNGGWMLQGEIGNFEKRAARAQGPE